jgi:predicted Zn-dependent protease
MKIIRKILPAILLLLTVTIASAQTNEEAHALLQEGVRLNDQGKYAEAIEKYNAALKIDPEYLYADFEMAFTLFASGKGDDGISYLEKVIKANTNLSAGAYDLLGSIYDKDNKTDKAIETYKEGIKTNPTYQRLHYNLGIVYFRTKQYAEAEKSAIEAIKLDPKHASSQRVYALVCFHQNKRVNALLGFCSFILLEPNTSRSAEAYGNIQHIMQGGVLKDNNGNTTLQVSMVDEKETGALNLSVSMAVISGQSKKLEGVALFEDELKTIFSIAGQLAEKRTEKTFFDKYFVEYFYKLAQSNNLPAFARMINQNSPESAKWINEHPQYMNDLYTWEKTTERDF